MPKSIGVRVFRRMVVCPLVFWALGHLALGVMVFCPLVLGSFAVWWLVLGCLGVCRFVVWYICHLVERPVAHRREERGERREERGERREGVSSSGGLSFGVLVAWSFVVRCYGVLSFGVRVFCPLRRLVHCGMVVWCFVLWC